MTTTPTSTPTSPTTSTSRPPRSHRDELTSLGIAVGGIWAGVVAISLLSPDLVSGSEQQHLPVAAFTSWMWGAVATAAVVALWARGHRRRPGADVRDVHRPMAFVVAAIWLAATAVAVLTPEMVTGSDPTRIPIAAVLAPIAAAGLTVLARAGMEYVASVLDEPDVAVPGPTPSGTHA